MGENQENKAGAYLLLCNQRVVQQGGLCGRGRLALGVGLRRRAILSSVSQRGEQSGPVQQARLRKRSGRW